MTPDESQPGKPDESEDLSFGALADDLEGYLPKKDEVEVPTHDVHGEEISVADQEELREKAEMEAKINAKVLGASGGSRQPMWVKSFIITGITIFLYIFVAANANVPDIGNYITLVIAIGAAIWALSGISTDEEGIHKILNGICFAVSAVVAAASFFTI